jgi:hypothetical protein
MRISQADIEVPNRALILYTLAQISLFNLLS